MNNLLKQLNIKRRLEGSPLRKYPELCSLSNPEVTPSRQKQQKPSTHSLKIMINKLTNAKTPIKKKSRPSSSLTPSNSSPLQARSLIPTKQLQHDFPTIKTSAFDFEVTKKKIISEALSI